MTEFKFRDKVLIKASLVRNKEKDKRWWSHSKVYNPPVKAIFLGKRILSNGHNDGITTEGGYEPYFDHDEYIPGAWICIEGRNPEKVFLSDIELIVDTEEENSDLALEIAGLVFRRLQELKT